MGKRKEYNFMDIIEYSKDNFLVVNAKNKTVELSGKLAMIINAEYSFKFNFEEAFSLIDKKDLNKVKAEFYSGAINRKPIEIEFEISLKRNGKRWVCLKVKPFINDAGILKYFYGYIHDISIEKEVREVINDLVEFDPLTKLPSSYYIKDLVNERLLYGNNHNSRGALLLINIDNFKAINDSFGYKEGDLLLSEIASKLLSRADKEELICRYSGDEFIIFNPNINAFNESKKILEKIQDIFSRPFTIKGSNMYITASVGMAIFPENGDNFNELLRNAHYAMYRVKNSGKDGYEFFETNINEKNLSRELLIQKELKDALEKDELFVVFQPKVMLDSSIVTGFEALIRWQSNNLGVVGPNEFIPVAENTRLIIPIGKFVLEEVFKKVRTLLDEGFDNFKIAVNFSEVQFRYGTILEDFYELGERYNVPPSYIEVEITESILAKSFKDNIDKLESLRKLGATVALDDFGTGYSSFSYLTKLPIDVLKIDRSFVIDLLENYKSRCVIENIINLSHSLGIDVVAEGVEELEQVEYLKKVLCDIVQGYYYSEPKKFEHAKKLLGKKL